MKAILKTVGVVFLLLLATILVGWLMLVAFDRNADVECHKLQSQSIEFGRKVFFITKFEKAMCDDRDILIDASVR